MSRLFGTGEVVMPDECSICRRETSIPRKPITIPDSDGEHYVHESCYWIVRGRIVRDWQEDLWAFHRKMGLNAQVIPSIQDFDETNLRISLILEEAHELTTALQSQNLVEIADGIADLIYVALGTAISFGIDLHPIWAEVQKTNLAKEGGATRPDGKILKPEGWEPPKISALLIQQGWHD